MSQQGPSQKEIETRKRQLETMRQELKGIQKQFDRLAQNILDSEKSISADEEKRSNIQKEVAGNLKERLQQLTGFSWEETSDHPNRLRSEQLGDDVYTLGQMVGRVVPDSETNFTVAQGKISLDKQDAINMLTDLKIMGRNDTDFKTQLSTYDKMVMLETLEKITGKQWKIDDKTTVSTAEAFQSKEKQDGFSKHIIDELGKAIQNLRLDSDDTGLHMNLQQARTISMQHDAAHAKLKSEEIYAWLPKQESSYVQFTKEQTKQKEASEAQRMALEENKRSLEHLMQRTQADIKNKQLKEPVELAVTIADISQELLGLTMTELGEKRGFKGKTSETANKAFVSKINDILAPTGKTLSDLFSDQRAAVTLKNWSALKGLQSIAESDVVKKPRLGQ